MKGRWYSTAALAVLCVALAMLVCYPCSLYPQTLPLTQGDAGHALITAQLGADWFGRSSAGLMYPDGIDLPVLAWPTQLIAVPLSLGLAPLVAWNIATMVTVAIQGLALLALGTAWGWSSGQRCVAVVAAMTCPPLITFMGNGQPENLSFAALALVAWALGSPGRARLGWAFLGLLMAAFSTPYQAIVAGGLMLALACAHDRRTLAKLAALVALGAWLVFHCYGDQIETAGPIDQQQRVDVFGGAQYPRVKDTAAIVDLVWPRVDGVLGHTAEDVLSPIQRLTRLGAEPAWASPENLGMHQQPISSGHLGLMLAVVGALGLIRTRRPPFHRYIVIWAAVCLLISMGPRLSIFASQPTQMPMPWAALSWWPAVEVMGSTARFLMGTAFALVLGAALACRDCSLGKAALLATVLGVLNLATAPALWPRPAVRLDPSTIAAQLPPGPIAVWPYTELETIERDQSLALALNRQLAQYPRPTPVEPGQLKG